MPATIRFTATILKFDKQGEKTGWSYIHIPAHLAQELKPDFKKSFRVKGKLDGHAIKQVSLLPMGEGDFIMPFNATMRKGTGKREGAMLDVQLQEDKTEIALPADFAECLEIDAEAKAYFNSIPKSHQNYWIKWLDAVKTPEARDSRLMRATAALAKGWGFAEMLRAEKALRS
jgi:hypothetical protein